MDREERNWLLAHREVAAVLNQSLAKSAAGALLHPCKWKLDKEGVLRQGADPIEWACDSCGTHYADAGRGSCTHKYCPAAIRAEVAHTAWKAVEEFVNKRIPGYNPDRAPTPEQREAPATMEFACLEEQAKRAQPTATKPCPKCATRDPSNVWPCTVCGALTPHGGRL